MSGIAIVLHFACPTITKNMVGAVVALLWNGSSLTASSVKILDQASTLEKAYGVCGIAVGELIPGNSTDEIVVTTLDGKLLVYERDSSGNFGSLLYSTTLEGSVGAFNSIVIADLDGDELPELYLAGSYGLRRFTVIPPSSRAGG